MQALLHISSNIFCSFFLPMQTMASYLFMSTEPACRQANNNLPAGSTEKETSLSGEQLFKINCSQCHMPDKDFIAPSMAGVENRWKDNALLYAFVKKSQEVIQRDQYAKDLFIKWKQTPMLPFPQLTEE